MNDILSFCKFLGFTDVIQLKVHLADQYQIKLSKQDYHLYPFTELELYWYLLDNLASFFL